MKVVNVNGTLYLGKMSVKDGVVTVKNAMTITVVNRATIGQYLMQKELGALTNPTFGGSGVSYGEVSLTAKEQLDLDICKRNMKYAKSIAEAGMINQVFQKLTGK